MRLYSAALYALFWWSGEMKSSTGSSGAYSCSSQPATGWQWGMVSCGAGDDEGAGTARLLVALGPMLATMRTSPPRIMLGFPVDVAAELAWDFSLGKSLFCEGFCRVRVLEHSNIRLMRSDETPSKTLSYLKHAEDNMFLRIIRSPECCQRRCWSCASMTAWSSLTGKVVTHHRF